MQNVESGSAQAYISNAAYLLTLCVAQRKHLDRTAKDPPWSKFRSSFTNHLCRSLPLNIPAQGHILHIILVRWRSDTGHCDLRLEMPARWLHL